MDRKKIRLCAEWLAWCLDNGWSRADLPALERVFWNCKGWRTFKGYTPQQNNPTDTVTGDIDG